MESKLSFELYREEHTSDLEFASNLITTRVEEIATLGVLNDRFACNIEEVKELVRRNQSLKAEVEQVSAIK